MKRELSNRADLDFLLSTFYQKATSDELLGSKFEGINLSTHLPIIGDFWETTLFNNTVYKGSPFDKHIALELSSEHFERWIHLFEETVNEHFKGKVASDAIHRAKTISIIFQHKLAHIKTS